VCVKHATKKSPFYLITNVSNTSNHCYEGESQIYTLHAPVLEEHSASTFRVRDAAGSSKMLVTIYQTRQCHTPEDSNID
jgi:hypothetical protein